MLGKHTCLANYMRSHNQLERRGTFVCPLNANSPLGPQSVLTSLRGHQGRQRGRKEMIIAPMCVGVRKLERER